jgi:hypothetical protein
MAVYAEKRNGRLTGVFIAEVMHLGVRVRKRFDTKREADRLEADVKATGAPLLPAEVKLLTSRLLTTSQTYLKFWNQAI